MHTHTVTPRPPQTAHMPHISISKVLPSNYLPARVPRAGRDYNVWPMVWPNLALLVLVRKTLRLLIINSYPPRSPSDGLLKSSSAWTRETRPCRADLRVPCLLLRRSALGILTKAVG